MKYKKEPIANVPMMRGPYQSRKAQGKQNDRKRGKWYHLARRYRAANPICQSCKKRSSEEVHHIIPFSEDPSKELRWDNLMSVCKGCHCKIHGRGHIDRDREIPSI